MVNTILNILLIIAFFYIGFVIFQKIIPEMNKTKEGLVNNTIDPAVSSRTSNNGIGANAAKFAADLKAEILQQQDTLLIGKYKTDYENIILNTDDLINLIMLNTLLRIDQKNPQPTFTRLVLLKEAKVALNNVMKFVDSKTSSMF